jgi:hypothetical protein
VKGRKQALVEAILTGAFRPDRQGGLLLGEPLPAELPVDGCEDARAAWRALVEAQARGRESGAPDPWSFAGLVRSLHAAFGDAATLSELERFQAMLALTFGPWRCVDAKGRGVGPRRFTDAELEQHWQWARLGPASRFRDEWNEEDWGYRRFVLGETPGVAFKACRRLQREREGGVLAGVRPWA